MFEILAYAVLAVVPYLHVDASFVVTERVVDVVLTAWTPEGEPAESTGGVESLLTVTLIVVAVVVLDEVSVATAVIVWAPADTSVVSHARVYVLGEEGTVTADPWFTPSTLNWTDATAKTSVAVAVRVTVFETTSALAGLVIETEGPKASATATAPMSPPSLATPLRAVLVGAKPART